MALLLVFLVCMVTISTAEKAHVKSAAVKAVCDNTSYFGPSGVISSPNYPGNYYDNLYCDYNIYASTGSSFSIIFESFNIEDGYDFLTISCPTNASFTSKEYTGYSLPDPVSIPWCSQGRVNFQSDYSVAYSGFSLDYYISVGGCGNTVYSASSGYVTSPNWPNNYVYNQNCSNIIWSRQRSTFHLYFQSFILESCCSCDWLEIKCLDNSNYGPYRYCGTYNSHTLYIYECSQVLLWFHSDASRNYQGFNIQYNIYPDGGTPSQPTPTPLPTTTPTPPASSVIQESTSQASPTPPPTSTPSPPPTTIIPEVTSDASPSPPPTSPPTPPPSTIIPEVTSQASPTPPPTSPPTPPPSTIIPEVTSQATPTPPPTSTPSPPPSTIIPEVTSQATPTPPPTDPPSPPTSTIIPEVTSQATPTPPPTDTPSPPPSTIIPETTSQATPTPSPTDSPSPPPSTIIPETTSQASPTPSPTDSPSPPASTIIQATDVTQSPTTRTTTGYVPTGCGDSSYYGPSGVISSPNYPGFYSNNLDCDYNIYTSSSSSSIGIIFQAFKTEQDYDNVTINCSTNSSFPSVTYSGSTLPQPLSIPWCSQGSVNFLTDKSVYSTGFSLDYQISLGGCGDTVYTGSHGYVSSPNYPGNYSNNQNCSNIIWASQRSSFSIHFRSIQVEGCCDFVEISCLDNAEYGTHRFTGIFLPPEQYIPRCTQVLVWFYTDSSKVFQGFNLEYYVTPESEATSQAAPTALPSITPTPPASTVNEETTSQAASTALPSITPTPPASTVKQVY